MSKKTKVWTSEVWGKTSYLKWIGFDISPRGAEMSQKFQKGEIIDPELFPRIVYPNHEGVEPFDIGLIQDRLVLISECLTNLLREFDLGNNQLIAVDVYDHAKKVKQSDCYFILNVTEKKEGCFVHEKSAGRFMGDESRGYLTSANAYGGIAVRESAVLGGVDLWMDPILAGTPFFSGPLGEAIKKGKFGRTGLKPCVVIP